MGKKQDNIKKENKKEFDLKPIAEDVKFAFECHPGVSCFNECCHDIDVILTPFDVLRMKNRLGIKSDEFLKKYTQLQTVKDSDIPLLKLRIKDETNNKCVFLEEAGCSIYDSRPSVCRNYPTGLATQDPKAGQGAHPYFIIDETICKGHDEKKLWTISEWKENQGVVDLDEQNKPWLEIVARLKSLRLKDDKDQKMNIFIMVSFDIDTFKNFVFASSFLSRFEISNDTADKLKADEEELLRFGFKWLNFALFGEGPIRPKK